MPSQDQPQPLTAGVIGSGIAGLSAGIALRRAGFRVQMYERSEFKNEIGAAITVPPNATNCLRRWGFDFDAAGPVPNVCTRYVAADSLETTFESRYTDMEAEMGAPCLSFHRVDLHKGLRALATEGSERGDGANGAGEGGDGKGSRGTPVAIRLGCEVRGIDCENGILTLADGSKVQKDLVIIADGAHSNLLPDFLGHPAPTQPTGRSIYRWLVPGDCLVSRPEIMEAFSGPFDGFIGWSDPIKHVFWVAYACSGGAVLSNAVVHDTEDDIPSQSSSKDANGSLSHNNKSERTGSEPDNEAENTSWRTPAVKEAVLKTCSNFHPSIRQLVSLASEDGIRVHRLFKRPPMQSFVNGRTAVIGDAAHVMMPTHAAGCAMAIESAGTLEVLFRDLENYLNCSANGSNDRRECIIRERLELFDKLRIPRCNLAMLLSNAGPEGLRLPGVEEEIRKFYHGPLPSKDEVPWSAEFRKLLFDYNTFEEAERVLKDGAEREIEVKETSADHRNGI
ncbi:FAD/NAD(P)-binding domain-containing protein [Xylaria cf. heliscus]|nr:FAD/NAD(P)-binding domain-containing protein [Xylaria cf. heliscus]